MTTHIRVSSTCTPTPLVFLLCELILVRVAGRMKSPCGVFLIFGLNCPAGPLSCGADVGRGGIADGAMSQGRVHGQVVAVSSERPSSERVSGQVVAGAASGDSLDRSMQRWLWMAWTRRERGRDGVCGVLVVLGLCNKLIGGLLVSWLVADCW